MRSIATARSALRLAQFEREVTAERIRDKIAASKKKGMWMGGVMPIGYRVAARKLLRHTEEASQVREIFVRYLALGTVPKLQAEMERRGMRAAQDQRCGTHAGRRCLLARQAPSPAHEPGGDRPHPAQDRHLPRPARGDH
ncbi:hypothetical protein CNY89_02405 [Amaricoccus sp. HAR-UPW-R2A-40]|nr:hypothetical protein CNY89_02405 [Amaricoccus sp. HAR-UPW-R2A-40]